MVILSSDTEGITAGRYAWWFAITVIKGHGQLGPRDSPYSKCLKLL